MIKSTYIIREPRYKPKWYGVFDITANNWISFGGVAWGPKEFIAEYFDKVCVPDMKLTPSRKLEIRAFPARCNFCCRLADEFLQDAAQNVYDVCEAHGKEYGPHPDPPPLSDHVKPGIRFNDREMSNK